MAIEQYRTAALARATLARGAPDLTVLCGPQELRDYIVVSTGQMSGLILRTNNVSTCIRARFEGHYVKRIRCVAAIES